MAVTDGVSVVFKIGATTINALTNQNLSTSVDEIEVTTKDSGGSKEFIAGEFSGTVSIEGLIDEAAAYNYSELLAAQQAKAALSCVYGPASGGNTYSFSAILTQLDKTSNKNEGQSWSATLRITGDVTEA